MRLAVFSDTHGFPDYLIPAVRRVRPDILVHLGDGIRDTAALEREFPELPLHIVSGNCDFASRAPDMDIFFAGAVKVFAAHGHRYGVKSTLDPLLNSAHFAGAQLVLYGHTHIARIGYPGGMTVVNPGSAGAREPSTFAVIDISDAGGIAARILPTTLRVAEAPGDVR